MRDPWHRHLLTDRSSEMAPPVRFFVHLLPATAAPTWLGWPLAYAGRDLSDEGEPPLPDAWYAWRLMTANNRELARSVFRFPGPGQCRDAVRAVQAGVARLVISTLADPLTGQFSWRGQLDGGLVAAGKRYEKEQGARYAARRFLDAVAAAEITDVVRGLRDRRSPIGHHPEGAQ